MHLGFVGLGNLGKAIAQKLLDSGHSLTVWNRTISKTEGMGAEIASVPASVCEKAKIIFICLFDSNAVHSILTRDDGLLSGKVSNKILVDFSTNNFRQVTAFHKLCQEKGASYLEAPVMGSVIPASRGELAILISGSKTKFETVKPVLKNIANTFFFLKEPGLATKTKLINNLVLANFMTAIAEAVALGVTVGISKDDIVEILSVGAGGSIVLNAKKMNLLHENFSTHFSNSLMYKDLHFLQDLAYESKSPLFTGSIVKELYAKTFQLGIEKEDFSAIYKLYKKDTQ